MGLGLRTKKSVSQDVNKIPYTKRLEMYQGFRNYVLTLQPANDRLLLAITKGRIDEESLVKSVSNELVKHYIKASKKSKLENNYLNSLFFLSNYGVVQYRENGGAMPEIKARNTCMYRIYYPDFRLALNVLVGLRSDGHVLYIKGVFPVQAVM